MALFASLCSRLADRLRRFRWRLRFLTQALRFGLTALPIAGGAGDDDEEEKADDDADEAEKDDDESDDEDDDDEDSDEDESDEDDSDESDSKTKGKSDDDKDDDKAEHKQPGFLRRVARRNERRYKREKKRADRLEADIAKLKKGAKDDDADSEQTKAKQKEIEDKEAELEEERKGFRLEQAVERIARKGIKVGEGKKAKTKRFADPDDALVNIERLIHKGELDADEIFEDDGRVNKEALEDALTDLIESKPHLVAVSDQQKRRQVKGGADSGRGTATGGKALEDMSPDDHLKAIQKK